MSTRRFPTPAEPIVDANGFLSHNWYLALQNLTSDLVDVNFAVPRTDHYFCNWSQADETRITLTQPTLEITNQGATDGARLNLVLIQGIGAPHLVTFTSETHFGTSGPPILSTEQGARDRLSLVFNASIGIYDVVGFQQGFGSTGGIPISTGAEASVPALGTPAVPLPMGPPGPPGPPGPSGSASLEEIVAVEEAQE